MNIMVIGSGGREHAIGLALSQSPRVPQLFFLPGNPGTARLGINIECDVMDISGIVACAKSLGIDMVVVGPEGPLVAGLADELVAAGIPTVGPGREAAQLEGSKAWAKAKMKAYGIPTAAYDVYTDYASALTRVQQGPFPLVIKADGLASGKGVVVAQDEAEAVAAIEAMLVGRVFAEAGSRVVIESFLKGEEASVFACCDGETMVILGGAQDHKRIGEGDTGPNTGGMGAYSPAPVLTPDVMARVQSQVFEPLLRGFKADGIRYVGVVFAGLMIDEGAVSVVEFNVRLGDPETQVILDRLDTDWVALCEAMVAGRLSEVGVEWRDGASVCVVLAAPGYPGKVETGQRLEGSWESEWVMHAGTRQGRGDEVVVSGGRVLGVMGEGADLGEAVERAYERVGQVGFEGMQYRRDIGRRGLVHLGLVDE